MPELCFASRLDTILAGIVGFSLLAAAGFAARADDAWQGAAERIERHRKADGVVVVVDEQGQPVPGVKVTISQTRHAFLFGCNFFQFGKFRSEADEEAYRRQFADLFNYATLGFYWPSYESRRDQPQHEYAGRAARWCQEHGITVKGHPLAWNYAEPAWLPDDLSEIRRLQMARIKDCVSHFRGLIDVWDVVNEATHFERDELRRRAPKLTRLWEETGRVAFVDQCFAEARAANPQATLLINDYRVDPAYAQLITEMTERAGRRPYDVIGIQSHMHGGVWDNEKIWEVCERFAAFGVPLHFTELTILSGQQGWELARQGKEWPSTPEGEQQQARDVERVYTQLFSHPSVTAITWWDFADRNAWQRAPAGLIGEDLSPKTAYKTLRRLVKDKWWTRIEQSTDAAGRLAYRGFLGDYVVKVQPESGKELEIPVTLVREGANETRVVLRSPPVP